MIKINLRTTKSQVDISNIGGFDFTKLKIKALLFVIALIYVPDFVLVPLLEEEKTRADEAVNAKQTQLNTLKRKISRSVDFEKQIRELKSQEETLGKKLMAVKQAISEKRNPSALLLYIAKNIPNEIWLKELTINVHEMVIKGEALDYTSIGNFVNSLRSSVFIRDANIAGTSSIVRDTDKKRIETFEVKFSIERFDQ